MTLEHKDIRIIYQNQSGWASAYIIAGGEEFGSLAELANEHAKLTKLLTEAALQATAELSEQFGAVDTPVRGGSGNRRPSNKSYSGSSSSTSGSSSSTSGDGISDKQFDFYVKLLEENDMDVDVDAIKKLSKKEASDKIKALTEG